MVSLNMAFTIDYAPVQLPHFGVALPVKTRNAVDRPPARHPLAFLEFKSFRHPQGMFDHQ